MLLSDDVALIQIGDGAGNLENPVIGTCAQPQLVENGVEQSQGIAVQRAVIL